MTADKSEIFIGACAGFMQYDRPMRKFLSINPKAALLLIFLFSLAIRLIGLGEKQLWVDEIIQAIHSTPDSMQELLKGVADDRGSAPLDYVVQHYVMKAIGQRNEISARLHSAVFGAITILLIYLVGLNLFHDKKLALLSSALFGVYPFHQYYSQEGRPYALFTMLALILFLLHQKLRERFTWKLAALMCLTAIVSIYTHPYTAMLLMALLCIELLHGMKEHSRALFQKRLWTIVGVSVLSALAFVPWVAFSFHSAHGEGNEWFGWRLAPDAIKAFGGGSYPLAFVILALVVLGAIRMKKENPYPFVDLLCWIIVPIPVTIAVLYWRSYFFNARQLIFITPAIIFFAAYGLNYLLSLHRKQAVALLGLYFCICMVVIALHFRDDRMDFKRTGAFLQQHVESNDRVLAPNIGLILSFYFPEIGRYEQKGPDFPPLNNGRLFLVDSSAANATDRTMLEELQRKTSYIERRGFKGINLSILSTGSNQRKW
jgi:uncharacterized membrane protein